MQRERKYSILICIVHRYSRYMNMNQNMDTINALMRAIHRNIETSKRQYVSVHRNIDTIHTLIRAVHRYVIQYIDLTGHCASSHALYMRSPRHCAADTDLACVLLGDLFSPLHPRIRNPCGPRMFRFKIFIIQCSLRWGRTGI
jgi:hypothetical protein